MVSMWRNGAGSWIPGPAPYDPAQVGSLDSLTQLVRQLRDTGARVLVLGPVPNPMIVVPICLSAHLNAASACSPSRVTAVNESHIADESATTTAAGGSYADLTDLFCTSDRCPVIVGNTMVYQDANHMTLEYASQLAPAIGALTDRTLALG